MLLTGAYLRGHLFEKRFLRWGLFKDLQYVSKGSEATLLVNEASACFLIFIKYERYNCHCWMSIIVQISHRTYLYTLTPFLMF